MTKKSEEIKGELLEHNFEKYTKDELEKIKLTIEIQNLRNDLNDKTKPWYLKNLAILIPSIIGLATLLTGFFTGFFDAEKVNLENRTHDLVDSIKIFQAKKLGIQRNNIRLSNLNKKINTQNRQLSEQTSQLKTYTNKLIENIKTLNSQTKGLSDEKNILLATTSKLQIKVHMAPFDLLWGRFRSTGNFNLYEDHLRDTISHAIEYRGKYLTILKSYLDTCKDLSMKVNVQYLLYQLTNDLYWKKQTFKTVDKISDVISNNNYPDHSLKYNSIWYIIRGFCKDNTYTTIKNRKIIKEVSPATVADVQELLNLYINNIKKVENNIQYTSAILSNIAAISESQEIIFSGSDAIWYIRESSEFGYLLKICSHYFFSTDITLVPQGFHFFLRDYAPVALVCAISQELINSEYRKKFESDLSDKENVALEIIRQNFSEEPKNPSTMEAWILFQNRNQRLINLFKNISDRSDRSSIKELIGKTRHN